MNQPNNRNYQPTPHEDRATSQIHVLAGAFLCLLASAIFLLYWQSAFDQGVIVPLHMKFDSPLKFTLGTLAAKWCLLAAILYGIGNTLLYTGVMSGDTSRFPTTGSKAMFIFHGFSISLVGLLLTSQFLSISELIAFVYHSGQPIEFTWTWIITDGWIVFIFLLFGKCALVAALIPTNVRLLSRRRPAWLVWLGRSVVVSGVGLAIVEARVALALHAAPTLFRNDELLGDGTGLIRPSEFLIAISSSTGHVSTTIVGVHGILVLAFAIGYLRCSRDVTP